MSIFIPIILDTEKYYEHSFASSRALVGSPVLVCHLIEPPLSTSFVFEIATTQDGPAKYAQRSNHNWNLIMRCCKMEQITCIPCQVLILRTIWRQPNIRTIYYMLNISSLSSSVLCPWSEVGSSPPTRNWTGVCGCSSRVSTQGPHRYSILLHSEILVLITAWQPTSAILLS